MASAWTYEHLFVSGDAYFDALENRIRTAASSVDFEVYIFSADAIGERFCTVLCDAARRGVRVRIIVDAVGSAAWEGAFGTRIKEAGGRYKVYHRLFSKHFKFLNKRDHRKLAIIDGVTAFVGSRNISITHSEEHSKEKAWNDLSVEVRGDAIQDICDAFEYTWSRKQTIGKFPELVRMNSTRKMRRRMYRELLQQMRNASKRIWIISSYFVPTHLLIRTLTRAASSGMDVRLIIPASSDIFFLPWVTAVFQYPLVRAGVRIYEYLPKFIHTKSVIIDGWIVLGSSNLNHRSILHDQELDIVLTHEVSKEIMERRFENDMLMSKEADLDQWTLCPWWGRLMGRSLLLFRSYL